MRLNEERMPTRWSHEEHDETNPTEATTIQRQNESKFTYKPRLKRHFFLVPNLIQSSSTLGRTWGGMKSYVEQVYNSFT